MIKHIFKSLFTALLLVACACDNDGSSDPAPGVVDPQVEKEIPPVVDPEPEPEPEAQLVKALDISHWTGEITAEQVACWIEEGWTHLITGTYKPELTKQQLEVAVAGGMTVDAYTFLYWGYDITAQVQNALAAVADFPIKRFWLDCEADPGDDGFYELMAKIKEAIAACGDMPYGIYTGAWWWNDHMNGTSAFSDVPLWYSYYDNNPSMDTWAWQAFGGWSAPAGKQYLGTSYACGANSDRNTIYINIPSTGAPMPDGIPPAPTELSPDGETITTSSKTLTWTEVGGTKYEIHMEWWSGGNWKYYWIWSKTGPATSFTIWPQVDNTSYRWRVRAMNGSGWGKWSPWAEFLFN